MLDLHWLATLARLDLIDEIELTKIAEELVAEGSEGAALDLLVLRDPRREDYIKHAKSLCAEFGVLTPTYKQAARQFVRKHLDELSSGQYSLEDSLARSTDLYYHFMETDVDEVTKAALEDLYFIGVARDDYLDYHGGTQAGAGEEQAANPWAQDLKEAVDKWLRRLKEPPKWQL